MSLLETLPKSNTPGVLYDESVVMQILPQRDPFRFISYVKEVVLDVENPQIVAVREVKADEYYFKGHFPQEPIMPGVLQIETMAQAGCILGLLAHEKEVEGKRPAFMGVQECRFRKPVVPGDILTVKVQLNKFRKGIMFFEGSIYRGEELVSNATLTAAMV
ncbi:MAG TPA: 3-hydroxyacyl-ACP dehydratase FabZ [Fibrobacteraceae bacterium]|jgi:3-hydroxyacyl-[acyl-carrier-protein] dehydratase|nr:3-hydroxyacyl-ACP dehydratase FabZ [Fibrobacter sp.]HOG68935.1 3-hydroxyacyl-ACP dehydratase FabZ [Fibrobacteraceae bacterium]HQB64807.1 3-hydroxyacyl-ACP dehydratase FabZ [Fibrobacteraceae bacterium]